MSTICLGTLGDKVIVKTTQSVITAVTVRTILESHGQVIVFILAQDFGSVDLPRMVFRYPIRSFPSFFCLFPPKTSVSSDKSSKLCGIEKQIIATQLIQWHNTNFPFGN